MRLVHDNKTVGVWHVVSHLEGHWAGRGHVGVAGFGQDGRLTSRTSSVSGGSLTFSTVSELLFLSRNLLRIKMNRSLRAKIQSSGSPVEVSGTRSTGVTFLGLLHLLPDFEEFELSVGPRSVFVISILKYILETELREKYTSFIEA